VVVDSGKEGPGGKEKKKRKLGHRIKKGKNCRRQAAKREEGFRKMANSAP